jgi:septal ring factor EnvC (AmiA/AmiB activator)
VICLGTRTMELDMATLLSLLAVPAAAGAAYGGVKAGLNGAKQSLAQIERIVNRLDEKVDTHGERLASVETQTANLKERIASVTKSS